MRKIKSTQIRTVPTQRLHLTGVSLGFVFMTILIGTGLIQILRSYPLILQILQIVCFSFVLYLAWRDCDLSTAN